MALNDKKALYHSHLVAAGPVEVTITGNSPQKSQWAGRLNYIPLKHEGFDHWLDLENPDCEAAMSGLQGQTVTITASGRGADARIDVGQAFAAQPPRQQHQQQAQPPARNPAPAGHAPVTRQPAAGSGGAQAAAAGKQARETDERKMLIQAWKLGERAGILFEIAIHNAKKAVANELPEATVEDIRIISTTLFIEMKGLIDVRMLPTKWPPPAAEPPPRQQAPPPPPPPPEPELDPAAEDDIPF